MITPGRSTRHQPSLLLLGLPQDLRIEMRWPIYTPSCSTKTMAVPAPTKPRRGYMRRVAGGDSTTSSRWLSNECCLPLCKKATRVLHYSTWRIWGEPMPPSAQVRGDQSWAGTSGSCGVEKGWLRISLFCSEDCRLRCEMVKFAQRIGNQ
jgi:hypothetical protein